MVLVAAASILAASAPGRVGLPGYCPEEAPANSSANERR
jgi:hypothetical protein